MYFTAIMVAISWVIDGKYNFFTRGIGLVDITGADIKSGQLQITCCIDIVHKKQAVGMIFRVKGKTE